MLFFTETFLFCFKGYSDYKCSITKWISFNKKQPKTRNLLSRCQVKWHEPLKMGQKFTKTRKRETQILKKILKHKKSVNHEDISIMVEFIVAGYIQKIKIKSIPNDIIQLICEYYGNISKSNIINDIEWTQLLIRLKKEFNFNVKLYKIFEAKINGFSSYNFHKICDNKGPTICIIKNEYNYIFGGYTSKSWKSPTTKEYCRDDKAFLFGIKPKLFISKIKKEYINNAIEHNKTHSIVFGYCDLYLSNECNNNNRNGSEIYRYKWNNNCKLVSAFQTYATDTSFTVINYEVYQVL